MCRRIPLFLVLSSLVSFATALPDRPPLSPSELSSRQISNAMEWIKARREYKDSCWSVLRDKLANIRIQNETWFRCRGYGHGCTTFLTIPTAEEMGGPKFRHLRDPKYTWEQKIAASLPGEVEVLREQLIELTNAVRSYQNSKSLKNLKGIRIQSGLVGSGAKYDPKTQILTLKYNLHFYLTRLKNFLEQEYEREFVRLVLGKEMHSNPIPSYTIAGYHQIKSELEKIPPL